MDVKIPKMQPKTDFMGEVTFSTVHFCSVHRCSRLHATVDHTVCRQGEAVGGQRGGSAEPVSISSSEEEGSSLQKSADKLKRLMQADKKDSKWVWLVWDGGRWLGVALHPQKP